ncbi:helix-turn-helix domain-containing protein [Halodesulfovibrio spirochaetisodalis]|uniref:helix-turn-helix domain-containing protein n=1 Tax=Halodesulfovibrio spirochaetisodalis TaxID=1560234 RepID=UPI00082D5AAD|nr:AraC family transcriptional regulator [Halodesulfovibrio spirochaetisodalis]
MTQTSSTQHLVETYLANLNLEIHSDTYTNKVPVPESLGKGWTYSINLGNKVKIINRCICPHEDLHVVYDSALPPESTFGAFTLQGQTQSELLDSQSALDHDVNQIFWGNKPEENCASRLRAGTWSNMVYMFIKNDMFASSPDLKELSENNLMNILTGTQDDMVSAPQKASSANLHVLRSLLSLPTRNQWDWVRLESHFLELIATSTEDFGTPFSKAGSSQLSVTDIAALGMARDILISQMATPPSIQELAKKSGINEFKLKRGFKQYFGETVYGYLRNYRMETAQKMLTLRTMNVTEAALHVGYSNPSAFSAAYKKKFGHTPAEYRKR